MTSKEDESSYSAAFDHALQAAVGKLTHGISPAALSLAFLDWQIHLNFHPAKQVKLLELTRDNMATLIAMYITHPSSQADLPDCFKTTLSDKRFKDTAWQQEPFRLAYESFLMVQNWWHAATTNVHGVNQHHEDVVDFTVRQMLDLFSPSNYPWMNPEVIQATINENGMNFVKGLENLLSDAKRYQSDAPPEGAEKFVVGKDVAVTPGTVIYRNDLIELIQYEPQTKQVYAAPILITPAWIMKYYILDLSPDNSLVKYLLEKGHTVFMISWKNPTKEYRNTSFNDYMKLGTLSALDVISSVQPNQKVNLLGYCLGGTLAAMTAAYMARENDDRLASVTIFAAQTDFTEPGELGLFIDESQIAFLENLMREKGYLDTHQMAGTFQLLRSNDLVWSRMVHDYMLGKRKPLNDLMAWNADATRLPYKMHSQYLRQLFLNNELAESKYIIDDKPISLADINIPIFVVATERDHVSPWRSVFKINFLTNSDVTFTLTSGGHNVGIVSTPNADIKRHYRISTLKENDRYIDPEAWYQQTTADHGSWWPAWEQWLAQQSGNKITPPTTSNHAIAPAPGTYILES